LISHKEIRMKKSDFQAALLNKLDRLIDHLAQQQGIADQAAAPDWSAAAYRWRMRNGRGSLQAVQTPRCGPLSQLLNIDRQKTQVMRNTEQFLQGKPANNVLLWGARGTGKSTLVRALLNQYADQGLRLIEVEGHDLIDLPDIVQRLEARPERFILFTDDLSFEQDDPSYKALKSMLDGSIAGTPANVLIYATSNRRHLMPERMSENREMQTIDGEIHPGETSEEKVSLSERFGLWLAFHAFSQDEYLAVIDSELQAIALPLTSECETTRLEALRWALLRGSRSGRVAEQFIRYWQGVRTSAD
jgi:hypothetical protein